MQTLETSLSHLLTTPYPQLAAAALVLLVLLYLVRRYQHAHRGIVPFRTQGGNVEISPQTLRSVMQNAVASVTGVERAACRHFLKGRRLGVKVAIHLRANQSLREVESRIKKRIRGTLMDQFGMEAVEPIHIRVTRIIGDPVPSRAGEAAAAPAEEDSAPDEDLREASDDRPYAEENRL